VDIELSLVSKIILGGDVRSVIKSKITPAFFYGDKKAVFKFVLDYYGEYGTTPTIGVANRYFPDLVLEEQEEPLLFFCDELRKRQKYNRMVEGVNKISGMLSGGKVEDALKEWSKIGTGIIIETKVTRDLDFTADGEQRYERYEMMKKHFGMLGVPYPWDALNEATGGMLDEELITIVGFQGIGKSFILLEMLHQAWVEGRKVVLFTREMSPEQMERRLDALHFHLPFQDFKRGRLGMTMEEMYKSRIKELKDMPQFIISSDMEEGSGLTAIRAKLEEYQPDIFGIDGMYLVEDERGGQGTSGWEKLTHLTQDTKKICRKLGIPGIVTTQAGVDSQSKGGVSLTNIAFSKLAFGADSDIVIGIDLLRDENKWRLKLLKQREGETFAFRIKRDFNTMDFSQSGEAERDEPETLDETGDMVMY